jgi:hypothetical protein
MGEGLPHPVLPLGKEPECCVRKERMSSPRYRRGRDVDLMSHARRDASQQHTIINMTFLLSASNPRCAQP